MSAKQDRIYTRTASQLKQEFKFGESFAEVMGIANDARDKAEKAQNAADNPSANLTPDEVFNLLTNNGQSQGIYRGEDGEVYINASFIGTGILQSADGSVAIDLFNNTVTVSTNTDGVNGKIVLSSDGMDIYGWDENTEDYIRTLSMWGGVLRNGESVVTSSIQTPNMNTGLLISSHKFVDIAPVGCPLLLLGKTVSWKDNGDGTYTLIGT